MENQTKHQDHRNQRPKMINQKNYDQTKEARKPEKTTRPPKLMTEKGKTFRENWLYIVRHSIDIVYSIYDT